jgi:antirestriction protein ArdC
MSTVDPTTSKRDFRQEVTDQIVAMLERGAAPWQKPWEAGALQLPTNPTTGRNYRGGNAMHLLAVGGQKGYEDPRWLTYKQAQQNGWQVRSGEKGAHIEYWQVGEPAKSSERTETEAQPDNPRQTLLRRVYTVFNAQQIDGIAPYEPAKRNDWEIAQTGEEILRNAGVKILHDQNDRAFYSRAKDEIHLPPRDAFPGTSDYYGTALHELAHWSGHPSRLNRSTLTESYEFGDQNYAKEELRAELASVFLAAERGVPHNPEQHAAYLNSWISALKSDKNEIFRAAHDAHKAADFLLAFERTPELQKPNPLAQVEMAAKSLVGETTRLYPAQTQSARYRGPIVGEADQFVIQQIGPRSAIAHDKALLGGMPAVGDNVSIAYSNGEALIKALRVRDKSPALAR